MNANFAAEKAKALSCGWFPERRTGLCRKIEEIYEGLLAAAGVAAGAAPASLGVER